MDVPGGIALWRTQPWALCSVMRWLLALLWVLQTVPASAMTTSQTGILITVGAGGTLDIGAPTVIAPAWTTGASFWWGRYDEVYALGRFTSVGIEVRQAWIHGALEAIPALEVRRGNDVLVVGYHGFLSVGPVIRPGAVGVEALLGGGVKWRFRPHHGLMLRAGAGVAWVDDTVSGRVILRLAYEFGSPFKAP